MSENLTVAAAKPAGKGLTIAIVVSAIVTIAGIALWGVQIAGGLIQTGSRDMAPWGLYMMCFMFLVGVSTGVLMISSAPRVFGFESFGRIAKISTWAATVLAILAAGFVIIDLGGPARIWELFIYSNFSSPLMWDVVAVALYIVLTSVYLWAIVCNEAGKVSNLALRTISVIAFASAILLLCVDAWIFSLQQSREMWHSAVLAPWFIASALASGTALVLLLAAAVRKCGFAEIDAVGFSRLAKLLGVFILADLYFYACDLVTEAFPNAGGSEIVAMITTGQIAPFFWIEVIACAIAAVICFVPKLRTLPAVSIAAILTIIGVFCKRIQIIIGGFQIPNLDMAAIMTPFSAASWKGGLLTAYQGTIYAPTLLEVGIVIGVIGLGALLLSLGMKFLPLRLAEK